jgi:hypothetical protein
MFTHLQWSRSKRGGTIIYPSEFLSGKRDLILFRCPVAVLEYLEGEITKKVQVWRQFVLPEK